MNAILTHVEQTVPTPLDRAIDACHGHNKFALALGVRPPAVSQWKAAGRVPIERCADIERVTQGTVSLDDLAEMCPELRKILSQVRARIRTRSRTRARPGSRRFTGSAEVRGIHPQQGDLAMS